MNVLIPFGEGLAYLSDAAGGGGIGLRTLGCAMNKTLCISLAIFHCISPLTKVWWRFARFTFCQKQSPQHFIRFTIHPHHFVIGPNIPQRISFPLNRKKSMSTPIENVLARLEFPESSCPFNTIPVSFTSGNIKRHQILRGPQRKKKRAASAHAIRILAAQRKRPRKKKTLHSFPAYKKSREQDSIYIQSTHNNTIYTLTNSKGEARSWVSAGTCGFKNSRKATSYASQGAATKCATLAKNHNVHRVNLLISGLGPGRLSGVRALHQAGLVIGKIRECTNLPHNGCRLPNRRRV